MTRIRSQLLAAACVAVAATLLSDPVGAQPSRLQPSTLPKVGVVDERYQSYNVEMLEVTGGRFWRPYGPMLEKALREPAPSTSTPGDTPSGMNPALYEYRPPLDLSTPKLRALAAALGPAYVRVSGTWANTTFFPTTEQPPEKAPAGFGGVLSHAQWRGVIDFAKAVEGEIVTSFATGAGTRDASGNWTSDQARRWLDFTRRAGGRIAAAEWMNEPTLAAMGGAPEGYDAAAYGRDFKSFQSFAREAASDMLILGPGSVGETTGGWGVAAGYCGEGAIGTQDLLAASRPAKVDAFSYHHYGAVSRRCASTGPRTQTTPEAALTEEWLGRTDETLAFYRALRDRFEPGRPFWNTETADAACGGNPWANTALDTFRYLDQLGRLAKQEIAVVIHNTLVASDYGLLDDETFEPKPNYWAALLWRQLMGTTVLDFGLPLLHAYAHCQRGVLGGVVLLAINTSRMSTTAIDLPVASRRFTLDAAEPRSRTLRLNMQELRLGAGDALPSLDGQDVAAGVIELAPASITFLVVPDAGNAACR